MITKAMIEKAIENNKNGRKGEWYIWKQK
jgi:hypothetical protein